MCIAPLVQVIVAKTSHMLNAPLDANISLTGIVARLASLPLPAARAAAFAAIAPLCAAARETSLLWALQMVGAEAAFVLLA